MKISMATIVMTLAASAALAKEPPPKIDKAQAVKAVKERFKDAVISDAELETEGGKSIWSFDLMSGGKAREVWVDSTSGALIKEEVESPAQASEEVILDKAEALVKARIHGEIQHSEVRQENGKAVAVITIKAADGKVLTATVDSAAKKIIKIASAQDAQTKEETGEHEAKGKDRGGEDKD